MHNRIVWVLALVALAGCEVIDAPLPASTPSITLVQTTATAPALTSPALMAVPPAPVLLSRALAARAIGDDVATGADLEVLLHTYPAAVEARQARFFLAESQARRGLWTPAADLLRSFVDEPLDDGLRAPAIFWLARCYESAGDHVGAAGLYQRYRDLATPLEPYAAIRQAAQHAAAGQLAEAADAYEHAARADIVRGERAGSFERAIALRSQLASPAQGMALYDELLALAQTPAYRARILSEAAALAQQA
ncbi:MAG: lytic transglycosylase, partial [Oscillochloris sp.]|nr:lytic transglycosylase [Oscillochloris sp.]